MVLNPKSERFKEKNTVKKLALLLVITSKFKCKLGNGQ